MDRFGRLAIWFCSLLPCVASAAEPTAEPVAKPWRMTDADALVRDLDANQDGKLVAAEIPQGKLTAFARLLRAADQNQDAALTNAELAAALDASAAERGKVKKTVDPLPINPQMAFNRFDNNRDGKLTTSEVPMKMRKLFADVLNSADKNQDGALNRQELAAAAPLIQQLVQADAAEPTAQRPGNLFRLIDTNGDGNLSAAEMKVVEKVLGEISE